MIIFTGKAKRASSGYIGLFVVLLAFTAGCAGTSDTTAAANTSSGASTITITSASASPSPASSSPSTPPASPIAIPTTHVAAAHVSASAAAPIRTTRAPAPTTHAPAPTTQAPAPKQSTAKAQSCYPLTSGGNCYKPGEYCRTSDHGATGVDANGDAIKCENNNGWRWERV